MEVLATALSVPSPRTASDPLCTRATAEALQSGSCFHLGLVSIWQQAQLRSQVPNSLCFLLSSFIFLDSHFAFFQHLNASGYLRCSQHLSLHPSSPWTISKVSQFILPMYFPSLRNAAMFSDPIFPPEQEELFLQAGVFCFGGCLDSGESVCSLNLSATQSCSNYFQKVICH